MENELIIDIDAEGHVLIGKADPLGRYLICKICGRNLDETTAALALSTNTIQACGSAKCNHWVFTGWK